MKNCKKLFSGLLTIGFLATLATGCRSKASGGPVLANNVLNRTAEQKTYSAEDFADEQAVDPKEITVNISQNTTTETSQLVELKFRARTALGFQPTKSNYIAQIVDDNFSGDASNPVPADKIDTYDRTFKYIDKVTGHDLIKEVPLFDGIISYVTGSKSTAADRKVYIPSFFVKKGYFAIAIKGIAAGAVTEVGDEYKHKNAWTDPKREEILNPETGESYDPKQYKYVPNPDKPKITDIFIPNTIETVEPGAFKSVPADVKIHYEGHELPVGFADDWTDAPASQIDLNATGYVDDNGSLVDKVQFSGTATVSDLEDSTNFILGYSPDTEHAGEEYNKPLVVEYDVLKKVNETETRETRFEELPIKSNKNNYDGVGDEVGNLSFAKNVDLVLAHGERIDDDSIIVHNVYGIKTEVGASAPTIDLAKRYWVKPKHAYTMKMDIGNLVSFSEGQNAYFCGFSRFSLNMKKNLSYTSEESKIKEPHSIYLDLKTEIYEQNLTSIKAGRTVIRYSLYNLYSAKYHFVYRGSGGQIKDITIPIYLPSDISYQVLESNGNNVVACVIQDSDVAPDFSADKVIKFEIQDLVINMDLFTSSSSGTTSILGKSSISFTFAYVTVFDYGTNTKSAFNYNIFLIIFVAGFIVGFALLAVGLYFFKKNRYKNDEFRRVNKKKYIKSAIIGGLGATVFALAVTFIIMRFSGFSNSIVTFNPVDPFVIIFGIAGLIVFGYFIVVMVKSLKVAKERRKHIRLRLDEDVVDDGTN